VIALSLALLLTGCSKRTPENDSAVKQQPIIQGEATEASYDSAVKKTLAHAIELENQVKPPEADLDADIAKIDALTALAQQKGLDTSHAHDAALMSTEGVLYARKAQINRDNARLGGALMGKSYRYLDRAVSEYPDDLMARINRGMVSAKVPDFMGKDGVAHDDLQFVCNSAEFAHLAPDVRSLMQQTLAQVDARLASASEQGK
jgi:hypothetical protein